MNTEFAAIGTDPIASFLKTVFMDPGFRRDDDEI
jgi:hypothetical protein